MICIKISRDYTKAPGGRYKAEGENSGEDFRERVLEPKYKEALNCKEKLRVDLDGGYGYGSSFLEEAFGGLVRKEKNVDLDMFEIVSKEEPKLALDVIKYMKEARNNSGE